MKKEAAFALHKTTLVTRFASLEALFRDHPRDVATASTFFYRDGAPGKVGRQSQTRVRFEEPGTSLPRM